MVREYATPTSVERETGKRIGGGLVGCVHERGARNREMEREGGKTN